VEDLSMFSGQNRVRNMIQISIEMEDQGDPHAADLESVEVTGIEGTIEEIGDLDDKMIESGLQVLKEAKKVVDGDANLQSQDLTLVQSLDQEVEVEAQTSLLRGERTGEITGEMTEETGKEILIGIIEGGEMIEETIEGMTEEMIEGITDETEEAPIERREVVTPISFLSAEREEEEGLGRDPERETGAETEIESLIETEREIGETRAERGRVLITKKRKRRSGRDPRDTMMRSESPALTRNIRNTRAEMRRERVTAHGHGGRAQGALARRRVRFPELRYI